MCLTTNTPDIKIADKPIVVYKKLSGRRSVHIGFKYFRFFSEPEVDLQPKIDDLYLQEPIFPNYTVTRGYHSYTSLEDCKSNEGTSGQALFIIPKGAKYIKGWFNDSKEYENIVSSTIIRVGNPNNFFTKLFVFLYQSIN